LPERVNCEDSFYKSILDALHDAVYFVDCDRKITYWNQSAERVTGFAAKEVVGRHCYDNILMHFDSSGRQLCHDGCPLSATLGDGQPRDAEVFLRHKEGHRVPVSIRVGALRQKKHISGAVEIFHDISALHAARRQSDKLQQEAQTDPLTGLANRRFLEDALTEKLSTAKQRTGLLLMDIDHFKLVNDGYGHEVGDAVLKMVAKTLHHALRSDDLIGRWGGEEFLAIVNTANAKLLVEVGERCRILISQSRCATASGLVKVTVSIGAAMIRPDDTRQSLLERVDAFMYRSKQLGRNRVSSDEHPSEIQSVHSTKTEYLPVM
jgi:diguanylate cyclase (GGDEF)-like protein/PAS domain S-box-containing protein